MSDKSRKESGLGAWFLDGLTGFTGYAGAASVIGFGVLGGIYAAYGKAPFKAYAEYFDVQPGVTYVAETTVTNELVTRVTHAGEKMLADTGYVGIGLLAASIFTIAMLLTRNKKQS